MFRVSYHQEDVSILCDSSAHDTAESFAVAAIVLISFGILFLYTGLLWPHRRWLRAGTEVALSNDLLRPVRFLFVDFMGQYFYWEVVDMCRKLIITGRTSAALTSSYADYLHRR